jgi:hypothetical protein
MSHTVMNVFFAFMLLMFLGVRHGFAWLVFLLFIGAIAGGIAVERRARALHPALGRLLVSFLLCTPTICFTLAFFTVHFGGFYFVHGLFLNGFFPLIQGSPFGESIEGTFQFFLSLVGQSARAYWPIVFLSAVSRLGDFRKALESPGGPSRKGAAFEAPRIRAPRRDGA